MEIRLLLTISLLTLLRQVNSQARPLSVTWSDDEVGPDGPWQAVSISVGSKQGVSSVNLYPGGSFDSNILVTTFCNGTTEGCNAAAGGLYDPGDSPTSDFQFIGTPGSISGWSGSEPMNMTGESVFTLDTMKVASLSTAFNIEQAVFTSVVESKVRMPNGSTYDIWLGSLALGSPNPVQTFLTGTGSNVTGQLLTGNLRNKNEIPSSSFGLHIGSASLKQQGSLILGGFDQARIAGPVTSYDTVGVNGEPIVNLIDVKIGVQTGGTPFNTTKIPSLYSVEGKKSIAVVLNPLVPYMSLPPATCAAIARWLPVTYVPSIGLYTWNTDDYRYQTIISSPSYLAFTFQQIDNSNITIKVPFSLLNLTLQSPIVATPQQYFPCHPWTSPSSKWHLGRAFMQAAYLSINWEQNKFFLAQATGPGNTQSSIQAIQPSATTIKGSDSSNFEASWSSIWTVLPANLTSPASPVAASNDLTTHTGLSMGVKIGIGVGAGVAGILLLAGLFFLYYRSHRRRKQHATIARRGTTSQQHPQNHYPAFNSHPRQPAIHEIPSPDEKPYPFSQAPDKTHHPFYNNYNLKHEMAVSPPELDAPPKIHEADQRMIYEAPTYHPTHEMPSSPSTWAPRGRNGQWDYDSRRR